MTAHPAVPCRLLLLGTFQLVHEGTRYTDSLSPRMKELLAYLALRGEQPVPRQQVAFALWPETMDAQAQTNLRQLTHRLLRRLPFLQQYLVLGGSMGWHTAAGVSVDVHAFGEGLAEAEAALQRGEVDQGLAALERAVALYRGDLLADCYSDWVAPDRELWRGRLAQALADLVGLLQERGEYSRAVPYAEHLLALDEYHEPTYRLLMDLHAARGDRRGVQAVYRRCVVTLRRELGVAPEPATQALARRYGVAEARTGNDTAGRTLPTGTVRTMLAQERARGASLLRGKARSRAWQADPSQAHLSVTGFANVYALLAAENAWLHGEVQALRASLRRLQDEAHEEPPGHGRSETKDE